MVQDCWNKIGVHGDRSCPELTTFTHCRNCPVYATAGRELLEREPPADYVEEWTHLLASSLTFETSVQRQATQSVMIFRLGQEWLALRANLFKEITQPTVIHTLPHRSNNYLLGITNIRGKILICISLREFLGIEKLASKTINNRESSTLAVKINPVIYQRMAVIESAGESWVFRVDEMYGVYRLAEPDLQPPPPAIFQGAETYTKGIFSWHHQKVNYLNEQLLLKALHQIL